MWVSYNQLSPESRVWIFQSDKLFEDQSKIIMDAALQTFIEEWTSHSDLLPAHGMISQNKFVVLLVDESQVGASGCSIDKMFRFIQSLESQFGINLLLKNKIFILDKNQNLNIYKLAEIRKKIEEGVIHADQEYFDNTVNTKALFEKEWLKPTKLGWLGKYFD